MSLFFQNLYSDTIWIAFVFEDEGAGCDSLPWIKQGWWQVPSGQTFNAWDTDLRGVNRFAGFYADDFHGAVWSGTGNHWYLIRESAFHQCLNDATGCDRQPDFVQLDLGGCADVTVVLGPDAGQMSIQGSIAPSLYVTWTHYPDMSIYWSNFTLPPPSPLLAVNTGQRTATSPALAQFGPMQLVWRGPADSQGVYQGQIGFTGFQFVGAIPGIGSINGPALLAFGDALLMYWRGVSDDQGIYVSKSLDGQTWSPQQKIPGIGTATRPALVVFQGQVFMYWRGINNDQGIYAASSADGVHFSGRTPGTPQTVIPGKGTVALPTVAVLVSPGSSQLYMVWPGVEFDPHLYVATSANGWDWSPQTQLPLGEFSTGEGLPSTGACLVVFENALFLAWSAEVAILGDDGGDDGGETLTGTSISWSTSLDGINWSQPQFFMDSSTNSLVRSDQVPALAVSLPSCSALVDGKTSYSPRRTGVPVPVQRSNG
jgi:uncharacterized membrane protein